jgi:hypothetical protein
MTARFQKALIWVKSSRTAAMERFVAHHNISHFEELLRNEADPNERRILEAMLREERVRLAEAEARWSASLA